MLLSNEHSAHPGVVGNPVNSWFVAKPDKSRGALNDHASEGILHCQPVSFRPSAHHRMQLGAAGIVVVRFQIEKDRSRLAEPIVEQGPGQKLNSLTKAALSAIRSSTKSTHFPDGFARSSIELRAMFFYNQPADSVKKVAHD
jgi:hypothetical protein